MAIGHGDRGELDASAAVDVARAAQPATVSGSTGDAEPGVELPREDLLYFATGSVTRSD